MWKRKKVSFAAMLVALLFGFSLFACDKKDSESEIASTPAVEAPAEGEGEGSSEASSAEGESGEESGDESGDENGDGNDDGSGAVEKQEYILTYLVNGEKVEEKNYVEGEEIELFTPELQPWEEFLGWEGSPTHMPSEHLSLEANIRRKKNYLQLTTTFLDGTVEICLSLHGEVSLAGLVGIVELDDAVELQKVDFNAYLGEVNVQEKLLKFVCSQGENITREGVLFTLLARAEGAEEIKARLTVVELLAFDENGEIVAVDYVIG